MKRHIRTVAFLCLAVSFIVPENKATGNEQPKQDKADKNVYFAYRSFNPELRTMKLFHETIGVDTICFFPGNTLNSGGNPYSKYPPLWLGRNRYDFVSLDKQIEDILSANPEAKLLCMVDLNTPPWLTRHHAFDSFSEISTAASSKSWRNDARTYLEAFLKYAEEKHGDRIVAYVLSGGGTSEWYEYNRGRGSRVKNDAWRAWCQKNKVPAGGDPPTVLQLDKADFENFLHDPVSEPYVADYWKFHNEIIVDAMLDFAGKARSLIAPDKEIGFFFGYALVQGPGKITTFGHLDYERLYAAPEVDFFISPGNYTDRMMGGGSGPQLVLGTLRRNGKKYLHETDHRTSASPSGVGLQSNSQASDNALLKRESMFALINHSSLWWFDMWGGYYKTQETLDLLKRIREVWDQWKNDRSPSIAEVLLVVDPQSTLHINEKHPDTGKIFNGTQNKLNRLGTPYDVCAFNDIPHIDMDRYKMIVFPGTFVITPEREEVLKKHVLNNDRSIVWIKAPGIIDGKTLNPDFVEKWAGTKYGTTDVSTVGKNGWKSVYIPTYDKATPELLKVVASEAGVSMFSDENIPVYANEKLFAVHFAQGGKKTIRLPFPCKEIKDVFADKTVARDCTEFEYEFRTPDTVLFDMKR